MDALWPELDAPSAGANLRKAIHFARGAIGSSAIVVRDDQVALEADVEVDAAGMLAALDAGRLDEAIERYEGELLPEDRFEGWTDEPRDRLRAAYLRALADLAARGESAGDPDTSISLLARLVAIDPLDEDAQRRLMRLHAATGKRHLALRQFRQLERALRDELDLEPSAQTRALFLAIAADTSEPARAAGEPEVGLTERRLVTAVAARSSDRAGAAAALRILASWGASVEHDDRAADEGGVIGLFGLPVIGEDDAERAVRAAMEMARVVPGARVGIATGETVATLDRGARGGTIDAGPTSIARILADAAETGLPVASARTVRATGQRFRFGPSTSVPGLRAKQTVAPVLGAVRGDEPGLVETPLVGRRAELDSVEGFVRDVVERRSPRLVLLTGSAGVGKSRLVREAIARSRVAGGSGERPRARVLRGRSLAGGRGASYWALGELLREACGISLTDPAAVMEHRLRGVVDATLGSLPAEDRATTVAALAISAGIQLATNPLDGQKPDDVDKALGVAWPRFISGLAAGTPIVLVLEDLHWASSELVEMVELLVARSAGPLLVLATARPEFGDANPAFGASTEATTFALGPLSESESLELVRHLADETLLARGDRARILDRAEGNALYLEQLTTHLRETGPEGLPDTLQSLLGARLDALAPSDRRVLQEASVIGRAFWSEPLERALPGERVAARLGVLERKRFVVRRPDSTLPGHDEWAFRHALLHDVAYRSVPRTRRAEAHARAGTWLEGIAGSRVDEVADLLAHHYEAAVAARPAPDKADHATRRKAIDYLIRAGDGARRRFALDRAVDLHERAARIAGGDDVARLRSLEALADDHDAGFHGDAAALAYREALALAQDLGIRGRDVRARLARKLAWLMVWNPGAFRTSPDPAEAEALVAEGLAAAPGPLERGWLLLARGAAARLYRGSEPFGQGSRSDPRPLRSRVADVDQALAIARAVPDEELAAAAGHARGMLYGFEGRFREMVDLARAEVAGLPADASDLERADALRRLAVNLINIEAELETGIELGRQSRTLAGDTSPHQLLHTMWPIMAGSFQLGRWADVAELAKEATVAFRAEPATECQFVRDVPVIAGAALAMLGRRDDGRDLAALSGDPMTDRDSASAWQSRFATLTGRPALSRAISEDKALEHRTYGPQHAYAFVEALEALQDWEAIAAFKPRARSAIAGNKALRPLLDRAEGRAHAAAGDAVDARRLLRRSIAGFARLGMAYEEARAREALAAIRPSPRIRHSH